MAHGLSCSAACGIFPDQGSNPCPLHWQADSQPLCQPGKPQDEFLRLKRSEMGKRLRLLVVGGDVIHSSVGFSYSRTVRRRSP